MHSQQQDLETQDQWLKSRLHDFDKVTKDFFDQWDNFESYWKSVEKEIHDKKSWLKGLDKEFKQHEKKLKVVIQNQMSERESLN